MSRKAAVDWNGRTLCFPCLHLLREKKGDGAYSPRRVLHDNTAIVQVLGLAPVSFITAPLALVRLILHRQSPGSLVPRGRFRWWLALGLSIAVIAAWLFLFVVWIAMIVRAITS